MCITLARASRMRINSGDMISLEFPICIYLICARGVVPCRPQCYEPWSVDDCMNVVPQVYPSDVTTAMFLRTLGSREPDLQIYSIAQ